MVFWPPNGVLFKLKCCRLVYIAFYAPIIALRSALGRCERGCRNEVGVRLVSLSRVRFTVMREPSESKKPTKVRNSCYPGSLFYYRTRSDNCAQDNRVSRSGRYEKIDQSDGLLRLVSCHPHPEF
jgi:hypothetical protein